MNSKAFLQVSRIGSSKESKISFESSIDLIVQKLPKMNVVEVRKKRSEVLNIK